MPKPAPRTPTKSGHELDVVTKAPLKYLDKPGVKKSAKKAINKRARQDAKKDTVYEDGKCRNCRTNVSTGEKCPNCGEKKKYEASVNEVNPGTKKLPTMDELHRKAKYLGKVVTPKNGRRRYIVTQAHFYGLGTDHAWNSYMIAAMSGGDRGSHESNTSDKDFTQYWKVESDQDLVFTGKNCHRRMAVYNSDIRPGNEKKVQWYDAGTHKHGIATLVMKPRHAVCVADVKESVEVPHVLKESRPWEALDIKEDPFERMRRECNEIVAEEEEEAKHPSRERGLSVTDPAYRASVEKNKDITAQLKKKYGTKDVKESTATKAAKRLDERRGRGGKKKSLSTALNESLRGAR